MDQSRQGILGICGTVAAGLIRCGPGIGSAGDLSPNTATIAECLKNGGYATFMSGKWHVTYHEYMTPAGPRNSWPCQRGFDRYYGTLAGCGNCFRPKGLMSNNSFIEPDGDFYYTDRISDNACSFVNDHRTTAPSQPFFMYVAYTAPHWPLHARPDDIAACRGSFRAGWDRLREEKYERMRHSGLLDEKSGLSDRDAEVPAWDSLSGERKDLEDLKMSIYAAQITAMDRGVGHIVDTLGPWDGVLFVILTQIALCHRHRYRGAGQSRPDPCRARPSPIRQP